MNNRKKPQTSKQKPIKSSAKPFSGSAPFTTDVNGRVLSKKELEYPAKDLVDINPWDWGK
jgi:hypothetical protein